MQSGLTVFTEYVVKIHEDWQWISFINTSILAIINNYVQLYSEVRTG